MTGGDGAVVHTILDTGAGQGGLLRRLVEVSPGSRFEGTAGPGGELWFVIAGTGRLASGDQPAVPVRHDTGVWLPPGTGYHLQADGPGLLRLDSVALPAGTADRDATTAPGNAGDAPVPRLSELGSCAEQVTGDRRFRVLFGPGNGCQAATQFAGEIPPGRAPDHSHPYDEVVLVLAGEGVLHTGAADHPLAPGSCVHLPPGQPHCLENTGRSTLRVLGVFHPGGSPASKQEQQPAAR
ncbi:MAG TPA: cupin domain-containing protein [Streptosporangiaceae bacterium]|nr:cupin domain-containing protein [Streptosporangiaceae bacterium]